jgi:hypothetical protein
LNKRLKLLDVFCCIRFKSILENPGEISYDSPGIFEVQLTVTNNCGTSITASRSFEIFSTPIVSGSNTTQQVCIGEAPEPLSVTASGTSANNLSYQWYENNSN